MNATIYNQTGKESGKATLPEGVFGLAWNGDLVHQIMLAIQANTRAGTADTKGRGEVRGGGRKPWKQKGTGQARQGSIRSPIWKGGGTTHGPLAEKNYKQKVNKKMGAKALAVALSAKLRDGEILFVDELSFGKVPKSSDAAKMVQAFAGVAGFEKLKLARTPKAMLAIPTADKIISRSFRNIPQVSLSLTKDLNVLDILNHKYLIVVDPKASLSALEKRCAFSSKK